MNTLTEIFLIMAGIVSVYAIVTSFFTYRAIKQKRYKAYRRKRVAFDQLDKEVKEAFKRHK